jgi:regulator of cell morphogenesis and NO signaling
MTDLSLTATVGAIAASLPGAAEVFRKSGISFCCGGKSSLSDAALAQGIDPATLLNQLQTLEDAAGRDAPDATPALIAHILSRYHDTHRAELDALIPLAQRVETVHGDHEDAPLGLMDALIALHDELDSHMQKEEQVLFPMMLKGGSPMIGQPIAVMRQDHDDTNKQLKRIEHITHGITLPLGACGSWTALYIGLRKLSEDLVTHMHLENTVLFPRFAA